MELAFTWERLIPKQIADDAASKKILDLHLQRYETATRYIQGKKVLDIACGVGYGSQMLGQAGASKVVGVDVCPHAVDYARGNYQGDNVNFVCADAEQFQSSEQFDVVVSFETIEHLQHPANFVKLIRNLLTPEGKFILSVPLGETRHLDRYHLHAFSQEDIFGLLDQAGFSVSQHYCEDYALSRSDLLIWRRLYPAARLSVREQYFTRRGWQLIRDFIFCGGVPFPQLLVVANRLNNTNIA
jgi:2-polyprenyl-3-methyl-5-hydroxy-6-metoxy-1,4-benzoquinol methylase